MPDQSKNAGNEGDVMKHVCLHEAIKSNPKYKGGDEFWYIDTHTAAPCHFLPAAGKWVHGIGHLDQNANANPPRPLTDYADVAYLDMRNVGKRFPAKRTYLGSSAQVFHLLKENKNRVRMTLFEHDPDPARELFEYFQNQGAKTLLVAVEPGNILGARRMLRRLWDMADRRAGRDPLVMIVQGNSYTFAPTLWNPPGSTMPDFVLVDPFKIGEPRGQPKKILSSLSGSKIPFMCWTPLFGALKTWSKTAWSFEVNQNAPGAKKENELVKACCEMNCQLAWFSWNHAARARQNMYGCQVAFGGVAANQFLVKLMAPGIQGLPYLDLGTWSANSAPATSNFQNPVTYGRTPGTALNRSQPWPTPAKAQPGFQAWDKYQMAVWWP